MISLFLWSLAMRNALLSSSCVIATARPGFTPSFHVCRMISTAEASVSMSTMATPIRLPRGASGSEKLSQNAHLSFVVTGLPGKVTIECGHDSEELVFLGHVIFVCGSSIWKVAPLRGIDSVQMRPPCISTICQAMASPAPMIARRLTKTAGPTRRAYPDADGSLTMAADEFKSWPRPCGRLIKQSRTAKATTAVQIHD